VTKDDDEAATPLAPGEMALLLAWLGKRIGMAIQAATALDKPVGGLLSQFSPVQLLALSQAQAELLGHLVDRDDEHGIRVLAEGFQLHSGYREVWRP
jgi:hypothetical protein